MGSEWKSYLLSDIAQIISGGTPKTSKKEYWDGVIPWLSVADFNNGRRYVKNAEKSITELGLKNSPARLLNPGDTIISARGTVGVVAQIHHLMAFNQSCYGLRAIDNLVISDFLYYAVKNVSSDLKQLANGGVFDTIIKETFTRVKVRLPSVEEQKAITAILNSLDDRIENLRETNATLEAIAQALFKSWFVDFDPVRAKAKGRQPEGINAETAALFPDSFEESALGLIPKGWRIHRVSDVSEVIKGKSYSSRDLVNESPTALVTLKSFGRGGGFRLDGFKPYIGSYKLSQIVIPGDLIVAYTDVTQAAELIGKPAIVVGLQEFNTLVASLDVGIIKPSLQTVSRQFLYGLFKTNSFQSHTLAHTSGTTVLHLSKNAIGSFKFVCPDQKIIEAFTNIAESIANRNQICIDIIHTLATLRDTLLPRLISGQLRLPEVATSAKGTTP